MARFRDWLGGVLGRRTSPPPPPPPPPPGPPVQPDWHLTLLRLHNEARVARGAPPLSPDVKLRQAAQAYAEWLAANQTLPAGHTGPGGNTMGERITATGYVFRTAGENIARGQATAEAVFDAWMNSTGHFRNIVNAAFGHFGAGRAVDAAGRVYWCCDFAAPAKPGATMELVYLHAPAGLDAGAAGPE